MRTRDVLRWNFSPWDTLAIAGIALAGFVLGCCDLAADRLEAWIDRGLRRVHVRGEVHDGP